MPEILDVSTEPVKPAQTVAPDTEPTGWMSPDGEIRESAPENIQTLFAAKKWTNIRQAVDAYTELEKFTGVGKHLVIPEAEDTEGWNNVYKVMGRPETHDKYELDYGGDVEISEELSGQFKQFAHGLGLTQKQFNSLVNFQLDAVGAQSEAYERQVTAQKEENIAALQLKWGSNYQAKVTGARIIADSLGIYQTLEAKGLASDPVIIEMLDTIANRASEDTITAQSSTVATKTPLEELEEIKKSEAFLKRFHPEHKKTMTRFMALNQEIANSGQAPKRLQGG